MKINYGKVTRMNEQGKFSLYKSIKVILKMWRFADPWKFSFYFGFLGGCTMPLFYSFYTSYIISKFSEICIEGNMSQIGSVLTSIGVIVLFSVVIYPLCFGLVYTTYSRICGEIQKKIFLHAQNLSMDYIESKFSGDIISRVTADYGDAVQLVAYPTVGQYNPFARLFAILSTAVIVCICDWKLGIISICLGVVSIVITSKFVSEIKKSEIKTKKIYSKASQNIINTLSGIVTSRIFGLDDYLRNIYEADTERIYKNNIKLIKKKSFMGSINQFQGFLSFTGIMIIGLIMSMYEMIDIPTVIFIASMQMNIAEGFQMLGKGFADMQKYIVGAERLFEFFEAPVEITGTSSSTPDYNYDKAIEIKNLDFKYSESDKPIFHNFNLSIQRGENVAIVGGSGGGKSTLFKLLLNFVKKDSGCIRVLGNDEEIYSLKDLRKLFSYVSQDCYIFDTTIEDNIAWGRPDATFEEIEEAAKAAYLLDYIKSLPDGFKTRVGERGSQISGGQKQRIAIARAFIKNAPIILLDEATSALDSESEHEVQKAIERLMKDRTSIVIAHRLSTIQNADRILVLEKGGIIEEGTHRELIEKDGRYKKLYEMQYICESE